MERKITLNQLPSLLYFIKSKLTTMTNDDLDLLKLELECEKFRLMSYQLDDLLEEYDNRVLDFLEII